MQVGARKRVMARDAPSRHWRGDSDVKRGRSPGCEHPGSGRNDKTYGSSEHAVAFRRSSVCLRLATGLDGLNALVKGHRLGREPLTQLLRY